MEFNEKLQEIEAIGRLILKGVTHDKIAKQFNTTIYRVINIKRSLGIRFRMSKPITEVWRSIYFSKGQHYAKFPLQRGIVEDLGYDPDKKLQVKGKISGTKLVLEFRQE